MPFVRSKCLVVPSQGLRCETLTTAQYICGTQTKKTTRYTKNSGVRHRGGETSAGCGFPSLVPCLGASSLTNFKGVEEEFVNRVSRVSREYNSRKNDGKDMSSRACRSHCAQRRMSKIAVSISRVSCPQVPERRNVVSVSRPPTSATFRRSNDLNHLARD